MLGICSIVLCCFIWVGLLTSALSITFGIVQTVKRKTTLGTVGLILGIVGAALFVLLIFMVATGLLEITYNISTP